MNTIADQFGKNLKRERERVGISQEELGLRASLHRTEVSQLERGLRTPRIDTLIKLAASLGVKPERFLDNLEWRPATITPGGYA